MKKARYLALTLVAALCVGVIAGCSSGGSSSSSGGDDSASSSGGTSSDLSSGGQDAEGSAYSAGLVLAVDDSQVTLQMYQPADSTAEGTIADPADFAAEDYVLSDEVQELDIEDESMLHYLEAGQLESAALADILPGSVLLVQTDETGGTPGDVVIQNYDQTWQDGAAQVVSVSGDSLEVTWYQMDGASLTSYLDLDVSAYTPEETAETLAVGSDAVVYQEQDGLLTETDLSSLEAGDNLIISTSSTGDVVRIILCQNQEETVTAA